MSNICSNLVCILRTSADSARPGSGSKPGDPLFRRRVVREEPLHRHVYPGKRIDDRRSERHPGLGSSLVAGIGPAKPSDDRSEPLHLPYDEVRDAPPVTAVL